MAGRIAQRGRSVARLQHVAEEPARRLLGANALAATAEVMVIGASDGRRDFQKSGLQAASLGHLLLNFFVVCSQLRTHRIDGTAKDIQVSGSIVGHLCSEVASTNGFDRT